MGFTRPTVMVDPTPLSIKNSVVQADEDFESRLGFADTGLLTGLGYKSLVGVAPVQDPAFCREARPCQRRELPSEGKGTTAAPPAVTSKCSCTGCRRRTTIRSRPRKKSSLRSSVGTGSSVQISTSAV